MTESEKVTDIIRLMGELKAKRSTWLPTWKDVTNYVTPRRGDWEIDNESGKAPTVKIYDTEAIASLNLLVDGLQGYLVSASVVWFKMGLEDPKQMEMPGVQRWLESIERVLYATFARSNFYECMNEFIHDGCSIGTAVMFVEDNVAERKPLFSTRHLKEVFVAEGRTGQVDSVYREYNVTNRQAVQEWGDKLTGKRLEHAKNDPFGACRIVHAVRPRSDRDPAKIDKGNKPFESVFIDKDEGKIIEEGGYDIFPYLVWRFRKNSDELYGRSPAIDAMPLILRLNAIALTSLKAAQLAVEPPLNVPSAMKGQTKIIPRGENYYTNPQEVITAINLASNYPISLDQEKELKEQIRELFRTKIFLLMEQLERGPYTATEIRERQGEKAAVLGSIIGRFNGECLVPLIQRTYAICQKNGQIEEAPTSIKNAVFKITFSGPLAQAQKRYHESQGVTQGLAFLGPIAQLNQESLDNIDWDKLMRTGMENVGMPQSVIREVVEVKKIRDLRVKALQAQQEQARSDAAEKTVASNADQLNKPVAKGSMLEGMAKSAAQRGGQQVRGAA
jgi:hypothetical protein